jgi:hypothetical protein
LAGGSRLSPDEVTILDPDAGADSLRRALAALARGTSVEVAMTIPPQAVRPADGADARLYGRVRMRRGG